MREMVYPEKVVVVGVSTRADTMGKNILRNLANCGFQGEANPVGREVGEIEGKPICPSPLDLPTAVDFAALLVPAHFMPRALDECVRKGVRRVGISTDGFNEYAGDGEPLAREILAIAERHGIRFLGPNCIGITNPDN
jgi:acetyltransferase